MRRTTLLATSAAMVLASSSPAIAHDGGSWEHKNTFLRGKVVKLHGKAAPGCDLVAGKCKAHPSPGWKKVHRYFETMRRMVMPAPAAVYVQAGPPPQPPAGTQTINPGGTLEAIAQCESGGDPTAVSPDGTYRGVLQFDQRTWESVGGTGDPAAAPVAEQYKRGAILYAQRGSSPWPVCGR